MRGKKKISDLICAMEGYKRKMQDSQQRGSKGKRKMKRN
jgi:hypothetical protein